MNEANKARSKNLTVTPFAVYFLRLCCLCEAGYYLLNIVRSFERYSSNFSYLESPYFGLSFSTALLLPVLVAYCSFKPSSTARSRIIALLVIALVVKLWLSYGLFRYVLEAGLGFYFQDILYYGTDILQDMSHILLATLRSMVRISINLVLVLIFFLSTPTKIWFDSYAGKMQP